MNAKASGRIKLVSEALLCVVEDPAAGGGGGRTPALGEGACALVVVVVVVVAAGGVVTALERCAAWSSGNWDQSDFSPAVGPLGAGSRFAAGTGGAEKSTTAAATAAA
jgi:hypothetical protein